MDELIINFIKTYGLPLGLIALGGVVLLCILKYGNVFTTPKNGATSYISRSRSASR